MDKAAMAAFVTFQGQTGTDYVAAVLRLLTS